MARNNNVEVPGGDSPDITGDALQTTEPQPQPVTFSVSTATKEQILEYFSRYKDDGGESIVLDADFSTLVDMALNPLHVVDIPQPAVTDGKTTYRNPVLTDKGWIV
ncbi:hypothetical protein AXA88_08965 [Salmonella enterica]|nr:hypothetical protein [Salmonella enterica]HEC8456393.1 hypothetical protein [Salmonella enterica subsp. enterica serovar Poona]EAX3606035.1 hypothetical protein [Salmonella enterica]EGW6279516.1 hypothetical protein [Salmonella enterica]EGX3932941.1 hypothetical protein [Salmonella enterica]